MNHDAMDCNTDEYITDQWKCEQYIDVKNMSDTAEAKVISDNYGRSKKKEPKEPTTPDQGSRR